MTPTLTAAAAAEREAERSEWSTRDPLSILLADDPALRNAYNAFMKGVGSAPTTVGNPRDWAGRWKPYLVAHRLACLWSPAQAVIAELVKGIFF
jgi:hypothetical protein